MEIPAARDMKHREDSTRLEGHQGKVTRLAVTPDSRQILSGGGDGTVRLWVVSSGGCAKVFEGHKSDVTGLAILPSGRQALSGGLDGTLRLWDMETGKAERIIEDEYDRITCLAVTPDGKAGLSGSDLGYLNLWDLASGARLRVFDRHPACSDMNGLISASNREFSYNDSLYNYAVAQTFDPETGAFFGHADAVTALAVTPDGRRAISGSRDNTLRLWDLKSGACSWIFGGRDGGPGSPVNDVTVLPGRSLVLSLSFRLQAWRLSSKSVRRRFWDFLGESPKITIKDEALSGGCLAVSPDGRSVFVSINQDRGVGSYRLRTGRRSEMLEPRESRVSALAVSPDGSFIAVGTADGPIVRVGLDRRARG